MSKEIRELNMKRTVDAMMRNYTPMEVAQAISDWCSQNPSKDETRGVLEERLDDCIGDMRDIVGGGDYEDDPDPDLKHVFDTDNDQELRTLRDQVVANGKRICELERKVYKV